MLGGGIPMTARRLTQAYLPSHQLIDVQKTLDSIEALRAQAFQGLKQRRAQLLAEISRIDAQLDQLDVVTRPFSAPKTSPNGAGAIARTGRANRRASRSKHANGTSASRTDDSIASSGRRGPAQMEAVKRKILNTLVSVKANARGPTNPTCADLVHLIPGATSRLLQRPLHQLRDGGELKTHGKRSGMRYFIASKPDRG
jgi:hypothetical protein